MKITTYILSVSMWMLFANAGHAQHIVQLKNLQPDTEFENIHIRQIYSDSLSSSFVIWIKQEVKPHYHAFHTESIYIIEGSGDMRIGATIYKVEAGNFFCIPAGTIHGVKTLSEVPLKVLSVQSPEFKGADRIQAE